MPNYLGQLYSPIVWFILLGVSSTLLDGCVRRLVALGNSMILSVNKYSNMVYTVYMHIQNYCMWQVQLLHPVTTGCY